MEQSSIAVLRAEMVSLVMNLSSEDIKLYTDDFRNFRMISKMNGFYPHYNNANCKRYHYLEDAFIDYKPGQILISFTEIGKFAIFEQLSHFLDMMNAYYVSSAFVDFTPYQIIISSERQRLVFVCSDLSKTEDIVRYAWMMKLSVVITNDGNQLEITVSNQIYRNYTEAMEMFEKLFNCIDRSNRSLSRCIHPKKLLTQYGKNRTDYIETMNDYEIVDPMSSEIKSSSVEIATQWLNQNNPESSELVRDYYERYLADNKFPVQYCVFRKLVLKF